MTERMLITKLIRIDETRADLYARGHQYKDLTLFDLSDLALAGINYDSLPIGKETPCRFWAHYELSDKLNQAGNPYKDIITLEPVDMPATATSVDTSALLGELRAIKALLAHLIGGEGLQTLVTSEPDPEPEPKPEHRPEPKKNGKRMLPARHVQAILVENLAENSYQACGILAKANLDADADNDQVVAWARTYRQARDAGATSDQAAAQANGS